MAIFKQGQLNQVLAVCVDKTDFASVESGVTSGFTCTLYTYKQNSSAATSATTLSRAPSVVRSGIIRVTMKAADTSGVDCALLKIAHASCADQYIPINFQAQDISDAISDAISDLKSNIAAGVPMTASDMSDIRSAISDYGSKFTSDIKSQITVAYAMLSDFYSDFVSKVPKAPATASRLLLLESVASDAHSAAAQANSRILVNQSFLSDIDSALTSQFNRTSDYISDIRSYLVGMSAMLSDVDSQVNVTDSRVDDLSNGPDAATIAAKVWSDFGSQAAMTPSDLGSKMGKLISRVPKAAATASMLSDFYSDFTSKVPKAPATASVLSDFLSDFQSRVPKAVATASRLLLLESVASDAHSAAAQANSRMLVTQSTLSDIDSALTSQYSDIASKIGNVSITLTPSDISDIASATAAAVTVITASDISDIASAVWAYGTRKITSLADVSLCASDLSDIRSAITAGGGPATISASDISDIASAVWANTIGARVDSRVTKVLSDTSDIYSLLNVGVPMTASDMSDIRSVVLSLSDAISNAYSAAVVGASRAGQASSRALLNQSTLSDIDSAISSQFTKTQADLSDIGSKVVAGTAVTSNINSMLTGQIAEMAQGIPPATPTPFQALMYLYMSWRNKTETTATNLKVFNDAGTAIAQATLSDDATTFTKTEFISGA